MTFAAEKVKAGRKPLTVCELDLDVCSLVYGVGSCTATAAKYNLLKQSEDFSVSPWVAGNVTFGAQVTAPDGTATADTLIDAYTLAVAQVSQGVTIANNSQDYTFSVYLKNSTATKSSIHITITGGTAVLDNVLIDWTTVPPTLTNRDADEILEFVGNSWYRFSTTVQNNSSGNTWLSAYVRPCYGADSDTGNIFAWGAQMVPGTSVGRYYKTTTTNITGVMGAECYQTRATCQDPANYAVTTQTYRFSEPMGNLPIGEPMFPVMQGKPASSPTRITEDFGLGHRASVSVRLQDFTHHDRGIDPYVATRTYDPSAQGTFFGRLRARNPYYQGRTMRILSGYITDPFDWANFETREYIIEEIRGPSIDGSVEVIGKDVLKLADNDRAKCPIASDGKLFSDLTIVGTTMSVISGTYSSSGWVRIGDEIIQYTGKTGAGTVASPWLLTGLVRTDLTWGSDASDHSEGDSVQQCKAWQAINVRDIIDELLVSYAGVSSGYINSTQWDDEESLWLSGYNLTTILSEPEGVADLIAEIQEQCRVRIWWDDLNQTIPLKSIVPPAGNVMTIINDDGNIIMDSLKVKDVSKDRVSQVHFYYDVDNYTKDTTGNYKRLYIQADTDAEAATQFGDSRIHEIKSRWFPHTLLGAATQTASRILSSRRNVPREISFSLDAKDAADHSTGDIREIDARLIQGADGASIPTRILILEKKESYPGHSTDYIGLTGVSAGPFGFIGPGGLANYTAASAADQLQYGFVSNASGLYSNGDTGHKII